MRQPLTSQPANAYALQALQLIPRLYRWAVASMQANHLGRDLSLRQLGVLYALREGASSPGQLARRLRVTPAVVTGLIDRLERQGYVRREAEPSDRRRFRLVLTELGLAVSLEVQQTLAAELTAQFASASPEQLQELGRSMQLVERALLSLEERTPPALLDEEEPAKKSKAGRK
ncbi:MarR family transcriptional regulator [Cystobacter fuscus]|uniref:MarR family winged helix-turn-helix transcriptional regulator n=1 Tax=Cystobacter fuscus TaxID=43 RepID=UPI002B29AAA6|nr:MarR family transcriptional regulator [Cystobacter fuscus]